MTCDQAESAARKAQAASDALAEKFERIHGEAHDALAHLERFWTSVYGPNEALTAAFDAIQALPPTFYEDDGGE